MVGAGANPEHTSQQRPSYPDTHEHERTGHLTRDGISHQQPRARVHVRDEEVVLPNEPV